MSTGGPDLFVVCKSCGSEVSPYITECPYCGNRLRKRAPKLDREGRVTERRLRAPTSLPRLRRGEIPGIRPDTRPYATMLLVVAGIVGALLWRTGAVHKGTLIIYGKPTGHWWHVATAAFTYDNAGLAFAVLGATAIFGWLLERRHGPVPVLILFGLGAIGGIAVTAIGYPFPVALGPPGGATAASSPPEVMAPHTNHRLASGTSAAKAANCSACARLRRVPPATARSSGSASSSTTPSIAGTASAVTSADSPDASAISCKCTNSPNPVTS